MADSGNHAIRYVDCGGSCGNANIVLDMSVRLATEEKGAGARQQSGAAALALALLALAVAQAGPR